MSFYFGPTETTPIFNNAYFTNSTGNNGISLNQADSLYVSLSKSQEVEGIKDFIDGIQTDAILPTANGNAFNFTTTGQTNFNGNVNLPSGKNYLVNNTALIPSQSSQNGKFLTTNGTSTSWGIPPQTAVGGSNTQIQYNNNGVFAGSTMTFNNSTNTLTIPGVALFSNTGTGATTFYGSIVSNGIQDLSSISTLQLTAIQKAFVGSPQGNAGTLYTGGGSITQYRGQFTGTTTIPLPQSYTGSGFIAVSAWNNSGNYSSATGVCRGSNGAPYMQMNGSNPIISGVKFSTVGPLAWGIQFSGTATNSTCYYSIWQFGDGQNG